MHLPCLPIVLRYMYSSTTLLSHAQVGSASCPTVSLHAAHTVPLLCAQICPSRRSQSWWLSHSQGQRDFLCESSWAWLIHTAPLPPFGSALVSLVACPFLSSERQGHDCVRVRPACQSRGEGCYFKLLDVWCCAGLSCAALLSYGQCSRNVFIN